MKKITKFKKEILIGLLLICFFFLTRLFRLTLMPIFTDEAIYVRWAEIARYDAAWRFISLSDGKQPLFVWFVMVIFPFFKDPLFAGRLVSVLAGLGTALGLFLLSLEVFKKKEIGFLAAGLYLIYPFALVYDRMALMDALVGTFAVWSLYFEILLVRTRRLDIALLLGMILGGAMMTKSSGFFTLYLLPFSLLLFPWFEKKRKQRLLLWLGLALVAILESQLIYVILRLSPLFSMIGEKNTVFIYPFKEWLDHPFRFLLGNLRGLWDWFIGYFSWPMFGLLAFSMLTFWRYMTVQENPSKFRGDELNKNKHSSLRMKLHILMWGECYFREKALFLIWFGAPFFALALFGKVLYPRFIFFMTLPFLPLLALALGKIYGWVKKPQWFTLLFLLLAFFWIRSDWQLLTNPYTADIPESDKYQYLNGWPAGGGINQVVAFLNEESKKGKIYVATEGTFGPLPYSLEVYLYKNHNVEIHGFWPLQEKIPEGVEESAKERPTYFVFNQTQQVSSDWPVEFLAKYRKGVGKEYLQLYRVLAEE